jgi:hypothetical protein
MNWIQIPNLGKIEIVEDWKYSGPLSKHQLDTMWSSFSYHSTKILCPKNINLIGLRGFECKNVIIKKDGKFYDCKFKIVSIRKLSNFKENSLVKIEVEDLLMEEVAKDTSRDLKLSEIFDL